MPTIEEFAAYIKALSQHDWYYDYSDDHRVYSAGKHQQDRLIGQAQCHSIYRDAYQAYYAHTYSGQDFSVDKRDRVIEQLRQQILSNTVAA